MYKARLLAFALLLGVPLSAGAQTPDAAGAAGSGSAIGATSEPAADPGAATATATAPKLVASKLQYADTAMGTNINLWLWTDDERAAAAGAEAVFAEMHRLDKMMTTWDPKSEVSQVNASAGIKPIKLTPETYAVIERAVDMSKKSKGVFDI
ncbi:MAG TPA: FAD:protein FMN transferase, partial [Kofleriaceae bacterium]